LVVSLAQPVPGRAACDHAGPAGRAVVAFKEQHVRRLAAPLAGLLTSAISDALSDALAAGRAASGVPIWVVPIPSRRAVIRTRGADHMGVLASRAARLMRRAGLPAHRCRALLHADASRDQVGLSRSQRQANVEHTLRALPVPAGLIVLVDDVTTSGATLTEAMRALRASGSAATCVATVTRTQQPRRRASGLGRD
jgi:predicted amidophosphoribosyltransferase